MVNPNAIKALEKHLAAMCGQYRNLCEIFKFDGHSTTWLEDSEELLQSITADAGEAIKFIDKVRDSLHHQHTSQNGGPEINDRCLACEADRVLNPRQGVCGECGGKGGYPEGFGGSAHPIACGTCKGSGKAPTVSPGNSKDGWLTRDQIEHTKRTYCGDSKYPGGLTAYMEMLCDMALYALTASSQEKRK